MILQVSYKEIKAKWREKKLIPDDVLVVSEVEHLYFRRLKLPCVHICP